MAPRAARYSYLNRSTGRCSKMTGEAVSVTGPPTDRCRTAVPVVSGDGVEGCASGAALRGRCAPLDPSGPGEEPTPARDKGGTPQHALTSPELPSHQDKPPFVTRAGTGESSRSRQVGADVPEPRAAQRSRTL